MRFLLDTNAISETLRSRPNAGFMEWFASVGSPEDDFDDRLNVSVLTVGEMRRGALRLGSDPRGALLQARIDGIVAEYGDRLVAVDLAVVERWAPLAEAYRSAGVNVGLTDELLASTALVHDLTIVTRNVRHFEHSGCRLLAPWSG
ncbi:type II toxin-antitoxin system VapC family toxin [uncultured Brevundimonas sp.]|uniref:type II toxin-antitoxin system VapC family toxin n=1 Tax=uncultured Brevundimonas sp. TaxID=213418 RepID=UPI002596B093|nr:type II toxin-antitoxin system VapC family toxin [uncultured Brevundimonas sp.]